MPEWQARLRNHADRAHEPAIRMVFSVPGPDSLMHLRLLKLIPINSLQWQAALYYLDDSTNTLSH